MPQWTVAAGIHLAAVATQSQRPLGELTRVITTTRNLFSNEDYSTPGMNSIVLSNEITPRNNTFVNGYLRGTETLGYKTGTESNAAEYQERYAYEE